MTEDERRETDERNYCDELQRRMLDWERDPKNFLRLQRGMLGVKTIAPVALALAGERRG